MDDTRRLLGIVMALATAACTTYGQGSAPDPEPTDAVSVEYQLKADLRRLVVAQEVYFSERLTYTMDLMDLFEVANAFSDSTAPRFAFDPAVVITMVSADRTGWSATATHKRSLAIACGVFIGSAESPLEGVITMGQPECPRP